MNQREQDDLNARLRARAMNLPRMVRCDHCSMPYYQTSAPHVCAEWVTKENRTMNESEKFITTGVFSHERNVSGNCSVSGCPCRGWSAQESTKKENEMNNNTTGYPVIDRILKTIAPTPLSELCRYSDDGVTHCGLMRESHATLTNHLFVGADEHEPVTRGREGEWRADSSDGWGYVWQGGACLAKCPEPSRAAQIVTEHNQYRSLLAERERLRTAAQAALDNLYERSLTRKHWSTYDQKVYEQLDAALNDQKGE